MSDRIIKSYVFHDGRCYFVSTINRDSSSAYYPGRYAETMVWEYDWDKGERGELLSSSDAPEGTYSNHFNICGELIRNGNTTPSDGGETGGET